MKRNAQTGSLFDEWTRRTSSVLLITFLSSTTDINTFNRTNETLFPIWKTIAGGNSSVSTSGSSTSQYWPGESSENLFDGNPISAYTNHGLCNSSNSIPMVCGVGTGFYLTLTGGPFTFIGFYISTQNVDQNRDPLTFTIEGSNAGQSLLPSGSSWTLIYNRSTGLTPNPGRNVYGALQMLSRPWIPFASYRFLVTSVRGSPTCASYTELVMLIR